MNENEPHEESCEPLDSSQTGIRTPVEHALVKISVWQTVLSLAGIFVAVVALYAALSESEEVRRQTAAAVWPYVQLSIEDTLADTGSEFSISLTNAGVGPAKLRSLRVVIDNTVVTDWRAAVDRVTDSEEPIAFSQNYARNRVLSPGEKLTLFRVVDPAAVIALRHVNQAQGSAISYCYCSIFEDCWLFDSDARDPSPQTVEACPDFGAEAFQL
ncbi:MAG: hypothetical protein ABJ308_01740 [Halieaceae bacterium]